MRTQNEQPKVRTEYIWTPILRILLEHLEGWWGLYITLIIALAIALAGTYVLTNLVDWTTDFERRDAIVQECLNSEQYTREECIILASGK